MWDKSLTQIRQKQVFYLFFLSYRKNFTVFGKSIFGCKSVVKILNEKQIYKNDDLKIIDVY